MDDSNVNEDSATPESASVAITNTKLLLQSENTMDLERNSMTDSETSRKSAELASQRSGEASRSSVDGSRSLQNEESTDSVSPNVVKRKRFIIEDDEEDDRRSESGDEQDRSLKDHSKGRRNRIIDDEEEDEQLNDRDASRESLNNSKVVMKNLKSLCDEESSEEEGDQGDEEGLVRKGLESSDDTSNSNEGPAIVERPKNPARASKTECENAISLIQKNAREDLIDVPYHCPEQKSLKDFLASLKVNKSKIITEEKVEKQTTKLKLLKDLPRAEIAPNMINDPDSVVISDAGTGELQVEPEKDLKLGMPSFGPVTLKGDANSMIDLETGQTFVKTTVADTLILKLMRNNNKKNVKNVNPKFRPEPIPGAPLKKLKRNLEGELEKKRQETIQKILEVEKVAKEDEEEILDDEEYELDSEDETKTKKKRVKKQASEPGEGELQSGGCEDILEQTIFNEDEEEVLESGNIEDKEDDNDLDEQDEGQDVSGEEEEAGDEDSEEQSEDSDDSDDQLEEPTEGKKTLKRIVAMEDSDDEGVKDPQPEGSLVDNIDSDNAIAIPLFEDIPTEGLKSFEFSATQNENELFDLCSGKFTTQLPSTDPQSQICEASQVRGFDFPTLTPFGEPTQKDQVKPITEECTDEVAGPRNLNLSSSEEEGIEGAQEDPKRRKLKRKKKRIVIEDEDDEEDDLPNDDEEDEEVGKESDEELPAEAIEELEEYENFLTGQAVTDPKQPRMKVTDFIEKEAELSDSEWGSEDEDERGLDKIEDIGLVRDDEDFDGEQLRDEVGRIHMRQMVNEDNRELKYLKDMILNEEELDGQARQRTFRWLNVNNDDGFGATTENSAEKDDIADLENHSSDEENEVAWRKVRYEREQTILASTNKEEVTMQSKLETVMRQTRDIKVIKAVNSGDMTLKEITSPSFLMQDQSKKYMDLRQSFLLRDEATLSRLASFSAKDCGSTAVTDGKQNFVFRRVEDPIKPACEEPEPPKKRKSNGVPFGEKSTTPVQKKRKV